MGRLDCLGLRFNEKITCEVSFLIIVHSENHSLFYFSTHEICNLCNFVVWCLILECISNIIRCKKHNPNVVWCLILECISNQFRVVSHKLPLRLGNYLIFLLITQYNALKLREFGFFTNLELIIQWAIVRSCYTHMSDTNTLFLG